MSHNYLWTKAVKPTAEAPCPVVKMALGAIFSVYFKNWDLAVPGSPQRRTFRSPRTLCLSDLSLAWPPKRARARPRLMSLWP